MRLAGSSFVHNSSFDIRQSSFIKFKKQPVQTSGDSFDFSAAGRKQAGLAGKLIIGGNAATQSKESLKSLSSHQMKLMGESLIDVREILDEMKGLSAKAADSGLSWDERIDMQIEMAELQLSLHEKTNKMGMNLAMPGKEGPFIDPDVHEQYDRTILFLEGLRSEGPSTEDKRGNIKHIFSESGQQNGQLVSFHSTDFELDENGYIKIRDELFDALPDSVKTGMWGKEEIERLANSESLYPKWMSKEDIMAEMNLSLLDQGSAAKAMSEIQEQIEMFEAVETEFNNLAAIDPTVYYQYRTSLVETEEQGVFLTQLGVMKYASSGDDGESEEKPFDVRLVGAKRSQDPIAKLFAETDELFKDKIYSSLGFGDLFKCTEKPKGVSPEQMAIIEELRARELEKSSSQKKVEPMIEIKEIKDWEPTFRL